MTTYKRGGQLRVGWMGTSLHQLAAFCHGIRVATEHQSTREKWMSSQARLGWLAAAALL